MDLPQEVVAMATLGTARSGDDLAPLAAPLQQIVAQLEAPLEGQLLAAVAGLSLQQKAGFVAPGARRPLPEPCAPDAEPPCSRAAMRHFHLMRQGHFAEVLPQWLAEVARAGQRIPGESLPFLLDAGRKQPELQRLIFPVIGRRGQWLARVARNRQWQWVRLDRVEQTWQSGRAEDRLALLQQLRWRDPDQARALLATTWESEGTRNREQFLQAFHGGLGPADEPFLEAALDDRSGKVRQVALTLLARLSGSAFVARMAQRLLQLAYVRGSLRGKRLQLRVKTAAITAEMRRDGLDEPPRDWAEAPAGWTLRQLLPTVPPGLLCERWELSREDLWAAGRHSFLAKEIGTLWGWAGARSGDHDFCRLVLQEALPELTPDLLERLVPALPAGHVEEAALSWLRGGDPFDHKHPARPLLLAHRRPWSEDLCAAFLQSLHRYLSRGRVRPAPELRAALRQFVLYIPPALRGEVAIVLQTDTSAHRVWEDMSDDVRLLLAFRHEMLQAIQATTEATS